MPKERNRDTFRVAKVTRVHPDSQDPKLHQRYEHNIIKPSGAQPENYVDKYELESVSQVDDRSSVSSVFSIRPKSPPIEIIRLPAPVNSPSRLTVHQLDAPSSILTLKPILTAPSSFPSFIRSPDSPVFRKVSFIRSKTGFVEDETTQKSSLPKKEQVPTLNVKLSSVIFAALALVFIISICIIIVLAILLAAQQEEPYLTSNSFTSSACAANCMMSLTPFLAPTIASWPFDGSLSDTNNIYPASYTDPPTVLYAVGNFGQAVVFNGTQYVYASTQFMNLSYQSWTIEGWLLMNNLGSENGIFGQCDSSSTTDQCLSLNIKSSRLHLGFNNDDLDGTTYLSTASITWHHVAFVYDYTLMQQSIYLDGVLEATTGASGVPAGPYKGTTGSVTIGWTTSGGYFIGEIDQLQVSSGAKTACEILNDATLTAYYAFDVDTSYLDSSINALQGTANLLINLPGRVNNAYSFQYEYSYFQSMAFTAYSQSEPFSVALWVKPFYVDGGTLIHLSSNTDGTSACFDLLGFSSSGQLIGQLVNSSTTVQNIAGPTINVNIWTHIVLTYSSNNGLALYTNGTFQGVSAAFPSFPSSTYYTSQPYMTAGNPRTNGAIPGCTSGTPAISSAAYRGLIDELRIYSRALPINDICSLFNP